MGILLHLNKRDKMEQMIDRDYQRPYHKDITDSLSKKKNTGNWKVNKK